MLKSALSKKSMMLPFLFFLFGLYFIIDTSATSGCGDYPGTYSFDQDPVGSNPAGWTIEESGGSIDVIELEDSHHKILKFNDISTSDLMMEQSISNVVTGTFELWIRAEQTNHNFGIKISDGAGSLNYLSILLGNDGHLKYFSGLALNLPVDTNYSVDTWIHVRITFNCSAGNFEIFINGVSKGSCSFNNNPVEMDHVSFTSQALTTGICYFDAIGYSWDPNYKIGDNMEERCPSGAIWFGDYYLIFLLISIILMLGFVIKRKKTT